MRLAAVKPPRLQTETEGERNATWLELFYDLVFVATVAMLGIRLAADTSVTGWFSYAAYFLLVWWLWASHTFYADRYDTDDLVYRFLAGTQMVAIAILAASVSTGPAASTAVFAAAYAAARILLLLLYARAFKFVPATRQLVRGYLIGFGIGATIWVVSIFVPEPGRFWLWGIALTVDLATPFVMRKAQAASPLDVSHLPERFGLFTILVLGESIVAVTVGLGHVEWQWSTTIAGHCWTLDCHRVSGGSISTMSTAASCDGRAKGGRGNRRCGSTAIYPLRSGWQWSVWEWNTRSWHRTTAIITRPPSDGSSWVVLSSLSLRWSVSKRHPGAISETTCALH